MDIITYEEFKKMDLRVAQILEAERVPGATKLLKLKIDLGTEQRQMVAGVAETYAPEELVGKKLIVIVNLKPAVIRGIESQAMLLAAVTRTTRRSSPSSTGTSRPARPSSKAADEGPRSGPPGLRPSRRTARLRPREVDDRRGRAAGGRPAVDDRDPPWLRRGLGRRPGRPSSPFPGQVGARRGQGLSESRTRPSARERAGCGRRPTPPAPEWSPEGRPRPAGPGSAAPARTRRPGPRRAKAAKTRRSSTMSMSETMKDRGLRGVPPLQAEDPLDGLPRKGGRAQGVERFGRIGHDGSRAQVRGDIGGLRKLRGVGIDLQDACFDHGQPRRRRWYPDRVQKSNRRARRS